MPIFANSPTYQLEAAEQILKIAIDSFNAPLKRPSGLFVTVSRQPGAGAISFSHRLAERLNRTSPDGWSAWDRELVEKVSAEQGIAEKIIEMIPQRCHSWLQELLDGLIVSENPSDVEEMNAYKRVILAIRALATAGHTIIVGRGGAFITQQMPHAIHLRLIAPVEYRIKWIADRDKISIRDGAIRLADIDKKRSDFYHQYWPMKNISAETFTMTLNTAELAVEELVDCVVQLIQGRERTIHGKE